MANTTGKKFGGRKKGTPNILTSEMRDILKNVMLNRLSKIDELLDQLPPKEQMDILVKLMPYVFPKLETISHKTNEPFEWESL